MDVEQLIADLQRDEAVRRLPYDDATGRPLQPGDTLQGKITVGVGRNLTDRGLTEREIGVLLATDIGVSVDDLDRNAAWWDEMPEPAQRALANMCFNLGWPRLSEFRNMLGALARAEYAAAADEALNSVWARQVGVRADRVAALFRSCS